MRSLAPGVGVRPRAQQDARLKIVSCHWPSNKKDLEQRAETWVGISTHTGGRRKKGQLKPESSHKQHLHSQVSQMLRQNLDCGSQRNRRGTSLALGWAVLGASEGALSLERRIRSQVQVGRVET